MELKPGYKQTEVGVIPEDWEITNLSSVSKVPMQNGVFFKPSHKGSGIKLINVGDLYDQVPINADSLELFDANENEKERFKVENGDLFFTRSSVVPIGIAHCNIYQSARPEQVVFDSHVIRVRPDTKKVLSLYLYRFAVSPVARKYLISHSKTATMTTIDQTVLGKCPVLIPPTKAEQTAIASALSDADALIQSLTSLIAKKRQIKQGAMQTLLNPYKNGRLKDGWVLKKLGEVAFVTKLAGFEYTNYFNSYRDEGEIIVVRGTNITKNKLDFSDVKTIPRITSNKLSRSKLFKGDLVFAYVGTIGPVCLITEDDRFHLGPNTCKIRAEKLVVHDYLYVCFTSKMIQEEIIEHTSIGAQPSLSMSKIRNFKITFPKEITEQTRIATILSDMDAEIAEFEAKLAKYRHIKQGMMQNLLTGRIRLI